MMNQVLAFYEALFDDLDPKVLRRKFLESLLAVQNVERGSLWVVRDEHYVCVEAMGPQSAKIKGVRLPKDQPSIVGWVIENQEITIAEGGKDTRHYKQIEDTLATKSNLILCFPLILKDGQVYGAVQLIDMSAEGDRLNLDQDYLDLLFTLVSVGAIGLSHSLAFSSQREENQRLKQALEEMKGRAEVIGQSSAFVGAMNRAREYARTDFPVLVTGESGTGKELAAQEIHRLSNRAGKPFLTQNCSAIPETLLESELFGYKKGAFTGATKDKTGLFQAANGGTVFLDEIGDMPLNLQARILRVLQEYEVKPLGDTRSVAVDVRIVAATNQDLAKSVTEGTFREDLYYRLNVLPLRMPPLRERAEDIPLLLAFFLSRDAKRLGLASKRVADRAMRLLMRHAWPGNIRELENFAKYVLATVDAQIIETSDLPLHILEQAGLTSEARAEQDRPRRRQSDLFGSLAGRTWEDVEREYVLALLNRNTWNMTQAARAAGVKRTTFASRMRRLGIRRNQPLEISQVDQELG